MDGVGRRFWGWGAFGAVMALRLAVISAETSLGLAYLRQTEFIILNNGAVSGFFAQKFRSVQRLKRVTAPSCGMIGRIRRVSPVMGWSVSELQRASPLMGQHASACRPPPTAYGVRATTSAMTEAAPAASRVWAASFSVLPLVITSSTRARCWPATRSGSGTQKAPRRFF